MADEPLNVPDRLTLLRDRIANGEEITQEDVRRIALLQAIDVVDLGNQFIDIMLSRERDTDDRISES